MLNMLLRAPVPCGPRRAPPSKHLNHWRILISWDCAMGVDAGWWKTEWRGIFGGYGLPVPVPLVPYCLTSSMGRHWLRGEGAGE